MKAARKISNHIFRRFFPNKTEIVADIYHHFLSLLYNRHTQPIAYQVSYVTWATWKLSIVPASYWNLELSGDDFQKNGLKLRTTKPKVCGTLLASQTLTVKSLIQTAVSIYSFQIKDTQNASIWGRLLKELAKNGQNWLKCSIFGL